MVEQEIQQYGGIGLIIFGTGRSKGFAIVRAGRRVNGKDRQPGHIAKEMDQRSCAGFDGQSDWLCTKARFQIFDLV